VSKFIEYCYVCGLKTKQMGQPRLKPIISDKVLQRVQLDLVDMRANPDGEFHWIGHMVDHNSQFHMIWPQKTKESTYIIN
jgi:hypothetical protein